MNTVDWNKIFHYQEGKLINAFTRNGRAIEGNVAGCRDGNGYWKLRNDRKQYYVHRVIWEMFNGTITDDKVVIHIDGDRGNNRIQNLKLVDYSEVDTISGKRSKKTLPIGVSAKPSGRYQASIKHNKEYYYLGVFSTPEEALASRITAEKMLKNYGLSKVAI